MANIRNNRYSRRAHLKESTAVENQHPQERRTSDAADASDYELRVRELESQGCTRSDAQSVVDAEIWCRTHKINPQNFH